MKRSLSAKLIAVLLSVAVMACVLVPQLASLAEESSAVIVADMTSAEKNQENEFEPTYSENGMTFAVNAGWKAVHQYVSVKDVSNKTYLYYHFTKDAGKELNIRIPIYGDDEWGGWTIYDPAAAGVKLDGAEGWTTVNHQEDERHFLFNFPAANKDAWIRIETAQYAGCDMTKLNKVRFYFDMDANNAKVTIGNVYAANDDKDVPVLCDLKPTEKPTTPPTTESKVPTGKVIKYVDMSKGKAVVGATSNVSTSVKNGKLTLTTTNNAPQSMHSLSLKVTNEELRRMNKKYMYVHVSANSKEWVVLGTQFQCHNDAVWARPKNVDLMLEGEGSFKNTEFLSNNSVYLKNKVDQTVNLWIRFDVSAFLKENTNAKTCQELYLEIINYAGDKKVMTFESFYLANQDADVPGLKQEMAEFGNPALVRSVKSAGGITSEFYEVKYTPVVKNKMNLMEVTADKATNDLHTDVFTSAVADISKAKYFYFYFEAPEKAATGIKLVLGTKSNLWYQAGNYGYMESKNTGIGWFEGCGAGSTINLKAGFKGWIRVALSDINLISDKDKGTAVSIKDLDQVKFVITGAGPKSEGRAYYFGNVYVTANPKQVPGLPLIDKVASLATCIQDFETYSKEGESMFDDGATLFGIDGTDSSNIGSSIKALSSTKGVSSGSFALRLTGEGPMKFKNIGLVGDLIPAAPSCVGKRYVAYHIVVPSNPQWKAEQATDEKGNPCFMTKLQIRSQDGDTVMRWTNAGSTYGHNGAKLLYDGAGNFSQATVLAGDVLLPFGFSGWVVFDTKNFLPDNPKAAYDFSFDMPGVKLWDIYLSQAGEATGDIYLDSLYAFNDGDYVPGMGGSSSGVSPSTGTMSAVPFAMVAVVPVCAVVTFWFVRKRRTLCDE